MTSGPLAGGVMANHGVAVAEVRAPDVDDGRIAGGADSGQNLPSARRAQRSKTRADQPCLLLGRTDHLFIFLSHARHSYSLGS